ncbi:MAG: hypothetical protein ACEPO8_00950 [Rhodothermaceae bacterium]
MNKKNINNVVLLVIGTVLISISPIFASEYTSLKDFMTGFATGLTGTGVVFTIGILINKIRKKENQNLKLNIAFAAGFTILFASLILTQIDIEIIWPFTAAALALLAFVSYRNFTCLKEQL